MPPLGKNTTLASRSSRVWRARSSLIDKLETMTEATSISWQQNDQGHAQEHWITLFSLRAFDQRLNSPVTNLTILVCAQSCVPYDAI